MTTGKVRVVVGPHRLARRYAQRHGWAEETYLIITRAHQLARLDPALVASIVMVKLHHLGQRIAEEIHDEVMRIKTLWPVPTQAAA